MRMRNRSSGREVIKSLIWYHGLLLKMVDYMKSRTGITACIIAITISLVVVSAGCTTSTNTTSSPTPAGASAASITASGTMAIYQNAAVGVTFSYPQNWTVNPDPTRNGTVPARYCNIWPNNLDNDSGMGFWKWDNPNNEALLTVVNSEVQRYISNYNGTVVQNVTSTTLGGVPALNFTVMWTPRNSQDQVERLCTYAAKGDAIYAIICDASPSFYNGVLNDYGQVINSFAFIAPTPSVTPTPTPSTTPTPDSSSRLNTYLQQLGYIIVQPFQQHVGSSGVTYYNGTFENSNRTLQSEALVIVSNTSADAAQQMQNLVQQWQQNGFSTYESNATSWAGVNQQKTAMVVVGTNTPLVQVVAPNGVEMDYLTQAGQQAPQTVLQQLVPVSVIGHPAGDLDVRSTPLSLEVNQTLVWR